MCHLFGGEDKRRNKLKRNSFVLCSTPLNPVSKGVFPPPTEKLFGEENSGTSYSLQSARGDPLGF